MERAWSGFSAARIDRHCEKRHGARADSESNGGVARIERDELNPRGAEDQGDQTTTSPDETLNVDGVQNAAALR